MAFAKDLRGQGSRLSTGQAEGGPHAPEEAAPPPTVGFRVIINDLVPIPVVTLTVRHRGMGTGISEASKRVPIFSFATQGGKQVSSNFRQGN